VSAIRPSFPPIASDPDKAIACAPRQPRLLEQVRDAIRVRHYSIRTEQAYTGWIRRFILFHGKRHPAEMGKLEVEAFLTHLAVSGDVAAPTQNQALSAVVFLYKEVLGQELGWMESVVRAKKPAKLPVVFTRGRKCARSWRAWTGCAGSWRCCCMVRGCVCSNAFDCASKISISTSVA
jgi:hypothetical protein